MHPSEQMREMNLAWLEKAAAFRHIHGQRWLGSRFFHIPGDVAALMELAWKVKPRTIVQTGIAAGGGAIFASSLLELGGLDRSEDPGLVLAIDPHLGDEARTLLATHPLGKRVVVLEGNSIDETVFADVSRRVKDEGRGPVMVILDLNHTHAHVLRELELYGSLVDVGSYIVVLDTIMEDLPPETFAGKPYGRGNNPGTAVRAFLEGPVGAQQFEVDHEVENRVLMTLAPGGFLRRARR